MVDRKYRRDRAERTEEGKGDRIVPAVPIIVLIDNGIGSGG